MRSSWCPETPDRHTCVWTFIVLDIISQYGLQYKLFKSTVSDQRSIMGHSMGCDGHYVVGSPQDYSSIYIYVIGLLRLVL